MPDKTPNNGDNVTSINSNTQIVFTIKSFFTTIGSILGIFAAFYFVVFEPRITESQVHQKDMYNEQSKFITEQFKDIKKSVDGNTAAIGLNTVAIKGTNDRFEDLNTSVEGLAETRGSFGSIFIDSTSRNVDEPPNNFASSTTNPQ